MANTVLANTAFSTKRNMVGTDQNNSLDKTLKRQEITTINQTESRPVFSEATSSTTTNAYKEHTRIQSTAPATSNYSVTAVSITSTILRPANRKRFS